MTVLSDANAKIRLDEYRILLKYMPFLQKNGFSDCGRGQIMGQMSLLQEFLSQYLFVTATGFAKSPNRKMARSPEGAGPSLIRLSASPQPFNW